MLNRRHLLAGAGAFAGLSLASTLRTASAAAVDASTFGVKPGATDQTRGFARMLAAASDKNLPVFLPAGTYVVAGLTLPNNVRLSGVAGATRIVLGGDGFLMMATEAAHIELTDLVIDGGDRLLSDGCKGLVDLRNVGQLAIDSCGIVASGKSGLYLERCAGRVERSTISGAADYGLYSVQAAGLAISGNSVSDCANGGILVHRWEVGEDGTLVTGNRVTRIAARGGGTGQYGNGINVFRADNVVVSGNIVSDCAFSAIRANSASNIQVSGNTCLRSGETAIYAEFAFQGAVIDGNIVDGAANGISVVNFNEGGRTAICSGNIVRNLSVVGPYPPRRARLRRRHQRRGRHDGIRQRGGKRAALRHQDRLGAVHAQRRRHGQHRPQGPHRHRRDRRRRRRRCHHLRQRDFRNHRRRHCRLPLDGRRLRRSFPAGRGVLQPPDHLRQPRRLIF